MNNQRRNVLKSGSGLLCPTIFMIDNFISCKDV